ncbi:MAG: monomethylamine:corrinoid methyltransferase, partial [Clostridia bacterium]|nr:monomethylamine:corrinoid methyltransferase [Clostridia bacterium]
REQANEIAKKILPKYEEKLGAPDKGLPIDACYDKVAQHPKDNYIELFNRVRNELIDLGMPLDKAFGETYMGKVSNERRTIIL